MDALLVAAGVVLGCAVYLRLAEPRRVVEREIRPIDRKFLAAVRMGDTMSVYMLLGAGADPNARDTDGRYAISLAAEAPVTSRVNAMLTTGECRVYEHRRGYPEIVTALVERGARTDVRDSRGWTPLQQASSMDEGAIVKLLGKPGPAPVHADGRRRGD